jgi:hypothetical protein
MPARASVTTVSGLLMSFFMACLPDAADRATVTPGARELPE